MTTEFLRRIAVDLKNTGGNRTDFCRYIVVHRRLAAIKAIGPDFWLCPNAVPNVQHG